MNEYPKLPKKRGLRYDPYHPYISIPEEARVQGPVQETDEELEQLADQMERRMRAFISESELAPNLFDRKRVPEGPPELIREELYPDGPTIETLKYPS